MAPTYPLPWPVRADGGLMGPTQISLALAQTSRSGGQAFTGIEQVTASPAARWDAKISLPSFQCSADLLVFRGFLAAMQGRVGTVLMPAFEAGRQPWPLDRLGRPVHPGLARFPRLRRTTYAVDPVRDAAADILVTALAAAINATQLVLVATQAGPILPGHRFSLGQHLHEIMTSSEVAPGTYNVSVRPWTRAAVGAGDIAEFRAPVCLMRLKSDAEGVLDLEANRTAHPALNLVEAV